MSAREGFVTSRLAPSRETATSPKTLRADPWLSDVCRQPVCRVGLSPDEMVEPGVAERLSNELRETQTAFAFAKVDTKRVDAVSVLQDVGFRTVDVNLTLSLQSGAARRPAVAVDGVSVSEVDTVDDDVAESHPLAMISGECFRLSRFHLDPRFCDQTANRIKHQWIANYLRGRRGDRLWDAQVDGSHAGFLAALHLPDQRTAVIDLIGVAPGFQGRGVGGTLIQAFLNHYSTTPDSCFVGTQAANTPSLRLYQKQGFSFDSSAYVLHWHAQ